MAESVLTDALMAGLDAAILLEALDLSLPLAEVYRDVRPVTKPAPGRITLTTSESSARY